MILEKIGVYGVQKVEKAIIAGLVTGDPVLLIGRHGTAKTLICRRLARALGLSFWAYDASKAMFEDVIGFPSPASLSSGGEVVYAPTPVSIWGKEFVLVDELSRAAPSMQNKWLEVIRSRLVMGKALPDLRHVFAAMNPSSYLGAHALDEALAGRFAVVVTVPEVGDMAPEDAAAVMTNRCEEDAPAMPRGAAAQAGPPDPAASAAPPFSLADLVATARARLATIDGDVVSRVGLYVMDFMKLLHAKDVELDGRRFGMMWRTVQAYLCVCEALGGRPVAPGDDAFDSFDGDLLACATSCLPFAATDQEVSPLLVRAAHDAGMEAAVSGRPGRHLAVPRDPVCAVRHLAREQAAMPVDEARALVTKVLGGVKTQQASDDAARAMAAASLLARRVCDGTLRLEPHDQHRVLDAYQRMTAVRDGILDDILQSACEACVERVGTDLERGTQVAALRMAFVNRDETRRRYVNDDVPKFAETMEKALVLAEVEDEG